MKGKISLAAVLFSTGLVMAFAAATADPCAEKFKTCSDICTNHRAECIARGSTEANCESRFKECNADCDKAKAACESKKKK